MTTTIVLLALLAAFLGLRLYSVLGKRSGHEQEHMPRKVDTPQHDRVPQDDAKPHVPDMAPPPPAPVMVYEKVAESGMRDIIAADRNFDVARFMEGAKAAYGLILEAFWKADREELKELCDDDVYESFDAAIKAREEAGEVFDNRLVRIDEARISDAELDGRVARLTVRFDADIASVIKDKKGKLIGGSLSDAVETHDIWTFRRDLSSASPAWILDETDEA